MSRLRSLMQYAYIYSVTMIDDDDDDDDDRLSRRHDGSPHHEMVCVCV